MARDKIDRDVIIQGDCIELIPKLPGDSVDLVVTDPPYFLPVQTYCGKRGEQYPRRTLAGASVLRGYFERVFKELRRVIKDDGTFYVFCDAQSYPVFYQAMFPYCKHVRVLIWDKKVSFNGYTWRHQHELIAWGELDKTIRVPTGDGDILKCRGVLQKDRVHPAEKPVELLKKLIEKHDGQLVLDPYMGSGSTGVACKELGRDFIGYELNPEYIEIAKRRLR